MKGIESDIAAISRISAVPTILKVISNPVVPTYSKNDLLVVYLQLG